MSPLDVGEILGAFVNTMTADAEFFVPFLEYTSNFKHFEIKDDRHS